LNVKLTSVALAALVLFSSVGPAPAATLNGSDIGVILEQRVAQEPGVGMIVATLDHGTLSYTSHGPVDDHAIFQIGSVTKTFTATILADMVLKGEVSLGDPIEKYLPSGTRAPVVAGHHITLGDLATQSSGLPVVAPNIPIKNYADPYNGTTPEELFAGLGAVTLDRAIGSKFEYSNYGIAVFGQLLARRAGVSYARLLQDRILTPLAMHETSLQIRSDVPNRFAPGHNADFEPQIPWSLGAYEPAGGISSSASDMVKFLRLNLGVGPAALVAAAKLAQKKTSAPVTESGASIGLVWQTGQTAGNTYHNGATGGYRAFIGMNADRTQGDVVLTNSFLDVDDIGFHLLSPSFALFPNRFPPVVPVATATLGSYVGSYTLAPAVILTVTTVDGKLYAQLTGQTRARLFPKSATDFYYRIVDAQITFTSSNGHVSGLVLHQNGRDVPAPRS